MAKMNENTHSCTYNDLCCSCVIFLQGPVAPWETLHLQKYQWRHGHYIRVYGSWRSFCYWGASICSPWPLASGTDTHINSKFPCGAFIFNACVWPSALPVQILLTEEFVEQMLGDLQELNTREEVSKNPRYFNFCFEFVQLPACFTLYILSLCADKVTKGVQLARKEAEDLCATRLCVW